MYTLFYIIMIELCCPARYLNLFVTLSTYVYRWVPPKCWKVTMDQDWHLINGPSNIGQYSFWKDFSFVNLSKLKPLRNMHSPPSFSENASTNVQFNKSLLKLYKVTNWNDVKSTKKLFFINNYPWLKFFAEQNAVLLQQLRSTMSNTGCP